MQKICNECNPVSRVIPVRVAIIRGNSPTASLFTD